MAKLTDRRCAVITGSSKGWGRAIAEGLAFNGYDIAVNGRSGDVDVVAAFIRETGASAIAVKADTTTESGVQDLARAALEAFGRIDVWANALGVQAPQPLLDLSLDTWDSIIRTQLTSYFLGSRCAARIMVDQGHGG